VSDDDISSGLRGRLQRTGEDALGRLAQDILDNPLIHGAISTAMGAREKAAQAQEVTMAALSIPSTGDIARLTRRVRAVSQRLEGVEDGIDRLDQRLASAGGLSKDVEKRLAALEQRLDGIARQLEGIQRALPTADAAVPSGQERLEVPAT
jgi:septal ring factor EnvC (AmiA/AmiB activator)